jgi:hypothetical protein
MKQHYKEGQGQVINVARDAHIYIVVSPPPPLVWWRRWLVKLFNRS